MDNLGWTFDEKEREWIDIEGTQYSEDKKTLKRCFRFIKGAFCIPNSVTSIGAYAFSDCLMLREIIIPESVTSIGDYAFKGCSNLLKIEIPASVTSIGAYAFNGCSVIEDITIPESVISIGEHAFGDCTSFREIIIPDSVTSIGNGAFSGCSSLFRISIPESVISIGNWTFKGCSSLFRISIPESVTSIGVCAFSGCSNLREINIPESVTGIGDSAFGGCSSLRKIEIPKSVEEIGEEAFWGCPIKSVNIPPNTEYLPNSFDDVTKVIKAKVAISYSWDSEEHKAWVRKLSDDLQKNGVYVILDQWELKVGQLIPHFMRTSIKEAERVICIMTPNYKKKTDKLEGGVGYEYSIIDDEIRKNITGNIILPILRKGSEDESCPSSLSGRRYLDFRRDDSYENSLNILLREIFKEEYL